jgi:hypothetical protein
MKRVLAAATTGIWVAAAACSQSGGTTPNGGDASSGEMADVAGDKTVPMDVVSSAPDAPGDSLSTGDTASADGTMGSADVGSPDAGAETGAAGDGSSDAAVASDGSDGAADATSGGDAMLPADAPDDADATVNGVDGGNPEIDYTTPAVTLTMTFTFAPGAEIFECQTFANPWGRQVDVKTYSLNASVGFHSMYAFYQPNATNAAVGTCAQGGLTFGAFTFFAGTPQRTMTYPPTVGATILLGTGFQLMTHAINTTSSVIQENVSLTMYVAKPAVVTNHAGVLFLNQPTMTVPATCTSDAGACVSSQSYTLPQDVNVVSSESVMYHFGVNFIAATSTGATLYQTTQWAEPPPKFWYPPLLLPSGTTVTWSCTDINNTGTTLTFGESALSNVMCISTNVIYPVANAANPVLGTAL